MLVVWLRGFRQLPAPADTLLGTEAGVITPLGGPVRWGAGVLVPPAQLGVQGARLRDVVPWSELATVNCRNGPTSIGFAQGA